MFRITLMYKDLQSTRLKIDGRLSGSSVLALKKECLEYMDKKNMTLILDFSGVSFVEPEGVRMLESITDERLRIVNSSIFIEKLLESLISEKNGGV